jgi:hypothetical protein
MPYHLGKIQNMCLYENMCLRHFMCQYILYKYVTCFGKYIVKNVRNCHYKIEFWHKFFGKVGIFLTHLAPVDKYSHHYNNNHSKLFSAMVRCFYFWNNSSRPRDINIDKLCYIVINPVWFTILRCTSPTSEKTSVFTLASSKANSCSEKRVKMFISACLILHFALVTVVLRSPSGPWSDVFIFGTIHLGQGISILINCAKLC